MKSLRSQPDKKTVNAIRSSIIESSLRLDARLLRSANKNITSVLNKHSIRGADFLKAGAAIDPSSVVDYWRKRKLPEELSVFNRIISNGDYPVFFYLSLAYEASDSTLFMPSPYKIAAEGPDGFAETVWLNPPDYTREENPVNYVNPSLDEKEATAWKDAGRVLSHAMLNVSHSIRMGDNPVKGFQALAHQHGRIVYVPDLAKLHDYKKGITINGQVFQSTSVEDERFLAMASALYLPLKFPSRFSNDSQKTKDGFTSGVIVMFSPVPHFWDAVLPEYLKGQLVNSSDFTVRKTWNDGGMEKMLNKLSEELAWLENQIDHYQHGQSKLSASVLNLYNSFNNKFRDSGPAAFKIWESINHGLNTITKAEGEGDAPSCTLKEYLRLLLIGQNSVCRRLYNNGLIDTEDFRIQIKYPAQDMLEYSFKDREEIIINSSEKVTMPIEIKKANFISQEPWKNIKQYGTKINVILLTITEKFLSVQYYQETQEFALKKLIHEKDSFETYYGLQHGFPLPSSRDNHGIGILLFNVVTADMSISKKLYMSPDGSNCCSEVWLPIN